MSIFKYTNIGGRSNNEDYSAYLVDGSKMCLTVCDGLGGHENGEVASKVVVEHILSSFQMKPIVSTDNMETLLQGAQDEVTSLQQTADEYSEMKTTVTCALIHDDKIVTGHVGDSRIYVFRNNRIIFESEDHSVPYALFKAKRIKKKEIRTHEDGNVVLRSIGSEWDRPKYEIHEISKLRSGDGILLCTDGFWEHIVEKNMIQSLKRSANSEQWMQMMLNIVQKNIKKVNHDNYTAITCILE